MKIDIHMHTKAVKSGDAQTRNIDPQMFCEIIRATDVKICALTNHNHFDKEQYSQIVSESNGEFIVWPGVEIDIREGDKHGHLLVIVNPRQVEMFSNIVESLLKDTTPDTFSMNIDFAGTSFRVLDAIYIPHYFNKSPSISDEDIERLSRQLGNSKRILKEANNSISAGIFISHGHKTIYGSDVKNWSDYQKLSRSLPDLRLPVDSFEQFSLLIERDDSTIDSIRNKKHHEVISVKPFKDDSPFNIEIWDDINVFFGSKGTGKTEILKALSKHYNDNGYKTNVFESNAKDLTKHYDLNGNNYQLNIEDLPIESCQDEFVKVRNSIEKNITSIRKYIEYFSVNETSKRSKMIRVKNISKVDELISKIRVDDTKGLFDSIEKMTSLLNSKGIYKEVIGENLFDELINVITRVRERVLQGLEKEFIEKQSSHLLNNLIEIFVSEISKKTGVPEKPTATGFGDYASNRIELEYVLNKIVRNIDAPISPTAEFVGDLGEKGKLFCKTVLRIQNGDINDSEARHLRSTTKNPEKNVAKKIREIFKAVYSSELYEKINDLNMVESGNQVTSIEDLVLFRRFFELNHKEYKPSNGESAMILLTKELETEKEIFIIDEPEKSLGNDYINDFIVPLLKEHAYSGKRVIIATHDANIAVRTLPYNSIYREHELDCYRTYFGNPFSNKLICRENEKTHDWKEVSMRTLEGGKEAFGERGKVYGNV